MTQRKKTVAVFTEDKYLFQKIKLELYGCASTLLCKLAEEAEGADVVLTDADFFDPEATRGIKMTRHGAGDNEIPIPFPLGFVERLVSGAQERELLTVSHEDRCAVLRGRKIKLTEVEFALLELLINSGGEYVSREELLYKIWNNSADGGVINVYVHYLREKLETDGEKIIISSRKHGYKISDRFTGGKDA